MDNINDWMFEQSVDLANGVACCYNLPQHVPDFVVKLLVKCLSRSMTVHVEADGSLWLSFPKMAAKQ